MIKPENWYEEMCDYIFRQLNAQISSGKTINVAYKDMRNNANNPQKFRCKTLATVYDFMMSQPLEFKLKGKNGRT